MIRNWRQSFPIITTMRFTDRTADTEWRVLTVWFLLLDRGHVVHGVQGGDPSSFFNFLGVSVGYLPSCEDQIREMDLNLRNIDAEAISFCWSTRLFLSPYSCWGVKKRDSEKADSPELFCVNSHHLRGVAKFNVKLFYFQGSVYSTDQTIHHDWKV